MLQFTHFLDVTKYACLKDLTNIMSGYCSIKASESKLLKDVERRGGEGGGSIWGQFTYYLMLRF